jgi:hypothetical protein
MGYIFEKMQVPSGWIVVVNSSRNYYSIENDLDKTAKIPYRFEKGFSGSRTYNLCKPRLFSISGTLDIVFILFEKIVYKNYTYVENILL